MATPSPRHALGGQGVLPVSRAAVAIDGGGDPPPRALPAQLTSVGVALLAHSPARSPSSSPAPRPRARGSCRAMSRRRPSRSRASTAMPCCALSATWSRSASSSARRPTRARRVGPALGDEFIPRSRKTSRQRRPISSPASPSTGQALVVSRPGVMLIQCRIEPPAWRGPPPALRARAVSLAETPSIDRPGKSHLTAPNQMVLY